MRPADPETTPDTTPATPRRFSLRRHWVAILVFIFGFAVLMYPVFTQWYYSNDTRQMVTDFNDTKRGLDAAEITRRLDLARAYNNTLDPSRLVDPYSPREQEGRAEYARMLEVNELLGHIEVPRIGQDIPVYAGTNDTVLNKGAGHLEGTSLPVGGPDTHSVITAHRGLPTARLFTDLDKMQAGDIFYMHNVGETLAYRVDQILTVEPSDF
ncbi:MAG: class C sortase, partial [Propionibacteriaceae bacterium]|nr:class C sortase [Propionibacteriaceae bacterium]